MILYMNVQNGVRMLTSVDNKYGLYEFEHDLLIMRCYLEVNRALNLQMHCM